MLIALSPDDSKSRRGKLRLRAEADPCQTTEAGACQTESTEEIQNNTLMTWTFLCHTQVCVTERGSCDPPAVSYISACEPGFQSRLLGLYLQYTA